MAGEGPFLKSEQRGHIWLLTLDRPPVNALSLGVLDEIAAAMTAAAAAPDLRVVVITAAGQKFFAAGADIGGLPTLGPEGGRALNGHYQRAFDTVAACPCPVICALNGMALGGGLELALACDIRLAAETAVFGLPEVNLGLIPGGGGTQRLPRLIPTGGAKKLLFTGGRIGATEALRLNLVDEVLPGDALLQRALDLAAEIAARGPNAVRAAKAAVNRGLNLPLAAGQELELDVSAPLFGSPESREGIAAFFEKRKPAFGQPSP